MTYIVTTNVNLVHPISHWEQEFDAKLLVCYIDIRDHLTTCHNKRERERENESERERERETVLSILGFLGYMWQFFHSTDFFSNVRFV